MSKVVKEAELKIKVQNWGGSPVFVAEVNDKELASEYSLEQLINVIDDLSEDVFKYDSDVWEMKQ